MTLLVSGGSIGSVNFMRSMAMLTTSKMIFMRRLTASRASSSAFFTASRATLPHRCLTWPFCWMSLWRLASAAGHTSALAEGVLLAPASNRR